MKDKEQLIEQLVEQMNKVFFYYVKRCNSRTDAEHLKNEISACGYTYLEYKSKYENLIQMNPKYKWKENDN